MLSLVAHAQTPGAAADGAEQEHPLPWLDEEELDPGDAERVLLDPLQARDARVVKADGFLAAPETYGDAIALYRDYLAEHPEDQGVRLRLARVLSWSGRLERALVEYDALSGEDADLVVRLERAETLSWAGRYRDAETAFAQILAEEGRNARAARGLARVYLWSGRAHKADRAYGRALEIEDDPEAREEWEGLHALYRPQVGTRVARRSDNADYFFQSLDVDGTTYLDLRTRVTGEASYWRTRGEIEVGGGRRDRRSLDGAAYRFGVERHLGPSWLGVAKLGHEAWDGAPDQLIALTELRFSPFDTTSITLGYEHGGAGRALDSFDAVVEGVRRDELALSLWQALPAGFELWTRVGGGWISDSNTRFRSDISIDYKPLEERELRFRLANSLLRYSDDSGLYYDPDLDIDNEFGAQFVQPLLFGTRLQMDAGVGYGFSREAGRTSAGLVFRTGSFLFWEWRSWALEVGGTFGQSRRQNVYRSHSFTAALRRSF